MKSSFCLFLLGLALSQVAALAEPTTSQLVGRWRHAEERQTYEYSFLEDGTFTGNATRDGAVAWVFGGKWSLEGDAINYEFTASSTSRVKEGTTDRDKLV